MADAKASPSSDATSVRVRDTLTTGGSAGHLYRQVLREALLMAARDEFNADTFDDVLREAPPADVANSPASGKCYRISRRAESTSMLP